MPLLFCFQIEIEMVVVSIQHMKRWRFVFQVGFEMVDAIAEAKGITLSCVSFRALIGKGSKSLHLVLEIYVITQSGMLYQSSLSIES